MKQYDAILFELEEFVFETVHTALVQRWSTSKVANIPN